MNTLELGKNSSSKFYGICMKFVIYLFVFIGLSSSYAGSYEDYFSAVKRDDGVGISALLARGFDGNVLDPKGDHALLVALRDKSLKAVSALLEDLELRGLLESTLVVMVGEFGRTPRVSNLGRDHWPQCYSAMLAGAGIRGGTVYGASDAYGAYVRDMPVSPENFGATLFHALGVPPETRLGADGFTHPLSTGQPVLGVF